MATSGVDTFTVSDSDIITSALQDVGVLASGATANAADVVLARRKLNMIVKQWSSNADYSRGWKMWTRKRAYVFLQDGQVEYVMGTDHASESYVATTCAVASAGASTLTLASVTGISASDQIAVQLATGELQWTTVSGAPAGLVVTLADVLDGAVAEGAQVFAYTDNIRKPLDVLSLSLRNTDDEDSPLDPHMSLAEYERITDKTAEGTPSAAYIEYGRTTATLFLNRAPADPTSVLRVVYLADPDAFVTAANEMDYPPNWARALTAQLTMDLCLPFGRDISNSYKLQRDEALAIAQNANPQTYDGCFEPNLEGAA